MKLDVVSYVERKTPERFSYGKSQQKFNLQFRLDQSTSVVNNSGVHAVPKDYFHYLKYLHECRKC